MIDKLSLNPNIYDLLSARIEELNEEIKSLKFEKFELENKQLINEIENLKNKTIKDIDLLNKNNSLMKNLDSQNVSSQKFER